MQEPYTDWTLVALSPLSVGTRIALAALVIAACSAVLWSYRGAKQRGWLWATRITGALLVLGFITEPALQLRVVRKIRNRLAVVIDRSQSMSLATENGRSRYDNLLSALEKQNDGQVQLAQEHQVDWFDLDGPVSSGALSGAPTGTHSDLLQALERARDAGGGRALAGIVLISDGADNGDLESATAPGKLSATAIERLKRLGAPVSTVDAALGEGFRDIAITDVSSDEFAFVHNTLEIDVTLEATGFSNLTLPVSLRREGDVIATQTVQVGSTPTHVLFKTKPDKIGEFVYEVSVPELAGEALTRNNMRSFVIQVIRDKIRVLQVSGHPSWDERFLRQHLKENPNVDLISFFILRTPTDDPSVPEDELSLIPFPVNKLFTTELRSFDVVILQNFDYRPYRMAQYLPNIRDAVREGLGLIMIGGSNSFSDGGYVGTPIDEVLPVRLENQGMMQKPLSLSLTTAGEHHPITLLGRNNAGQNALWRSLPALQGINRTGSLFPGATALVTDAHEKNNDGSAMPLVAVREIEQGRSMIIATDSLWRWRFSRNQNSTPDSSSGERAYHRFWSNSLRWLVRDPEHSRMRIVLDKRHVSENESIEATASLMSTDYQPVVGAQIRLNLERIGGGAVRGDDLITADDGAARIQYENIEQGAFRVTAEARQGNEVLGKATAVFVVDANSLELRRAAPRRDLLQLISTQTKGNSISLSDDVWQDIKVVDPEVVEIDKRRNVDLWDNAWALLAGIVLFAADWALRRRNGYL